VKEKARNERSHATHQLNTRPGSVSAAGRLRTSATRWSEALTNQFTHPFNNCTKQPRDLRPRGFLIVLELCPKTQRILQRSSSWQKLRM